MTVPSPRLRGEGERLDPQSRSDEGLLRVPRWQLPLTPNPLPAPRGEGAHRVCRTRMPSNARLCTARAASHPGPIAPDAFVVLFTCQTAHLVPAARFAPEVLPLCFTHPDEGVAERRESYGCSDTRGPAHDAAGQAPCVSRRRPPLGARTVAILGGGAALPLTGIRAGSVTANSRVRVVVPGGGPLPPGAAVTNASLRLQDASGRRPSLSKAENGLIPCAIRSQ